MAQSVKEVCLHIDVDIIFKEGGKIVTRFRDSASMQSEEIEYDNFRELAMDGSSQFGGLLTSYVSFYAGRSSL